MTSGNIESLYVAIADLERRLSAIEYVTPIELYTERIKQYERTHPQPKAKVLAEPQAKGAIVKSEDGEFFIRTSDNADRLNWGIYNSGKKVAWSEIIDPIAWSNCDLNEDDPDLPNGSIVEFEHDGELFKRYAGGWYSIDNSALEGKTWKQLFDENLDIAILLKRG